MGIEAGPMSSAPRGLRGEALRVALRAVVLDGQPAWVELATGTIADTAEPPAPAPVWIEPPSDPESGGPPALRPHELARWLERRD